MDHAHQPEDPPGPIAAPPFWRSRYAVGLLVFGAAATYFLLSEHRAHFLGVLPFLFLLACPLMHVFMHHGHGGHSRHSSQTGSPRETKKGELP
jgi:hypothetical protein